jgi:hypothetical protein
MPFFILAPLIRQIATEDSPIPARKKRETPSDHRFNALILGGSKPN